MVRVIVVDDEPLICNGIRRVMPWEELGCEFVGSFQNGAAVLESIEKLRPDLVISDIRMPKVDGLELTEQLRRRFPEIRVILLTGFKNFDYVQKGMELRTVRYILKPVDHRELRQAIEDAVAEIEDMQKNSGNSSSWRIRLPEACRC